MERNKSIYHLLCRAFGQCVSVPEIVDFDVFDVIAVCDINFAVNIAGTLARGGGGSLGRRAQCLHIQVSMASGQADVETLQIESEEHPHAGCLFWLEVPH